MRSDALPAMAVLVMALAGCGSSSNETSATHGDETGGEDGSAADGAGSTGMDGVAPGSGSDATTDAPVTGVDAGTDASSSGGGICASLVLTDTLASARASCTFTAGALVKDTLGLSDSLRTSIPIDHVIVMMKENRAFDHLLGQLHGEGQPGVEAVPATFSNPDPNDAGTTSPFHQTTTCIHYDPDHQWTAMHTQVNGGKMDGFVESAASSSGTNGQFALSYYDQTDFPFYHWLAKTYAINDRHFASVRSGTYPNRNFLLLGTADGVMSTGAGFPSPSTPTIFDSLDTAHVTWGAYSDGSLVGGTLNWSAGHANTGSFATFLSLLDAGTLPHVAFVDGVDNVTDDHPTADIQKGEAWTRTIYSHATASSLWPHLAILWTYDEGGGFFDHVPPPNMACVARPGNSKDTPYYELGVRIPMVVISPYARAGYVSHVVQEHTAITRFIETIFDLGALTSRDANSDALLDMFDFACPPAFRTPPAAPAAGAGGCH